MSDSRKTKKQLIEELEGLRRANADLQAEITHSPTHAALSTSDLSWSGEVNYQQIFNRSPIGVFQYDHNLQIIDCNERFAQILHSSQERLIGLDMHRLRDQGLLPTLEAVLAGEEGLYEGPYTATTSMAQLWIKLHTAPLSQPTGEIVGGVGLVEDITERKQVEQAIRQSEQRFRDIVTNMTGWVWEVNAQGQYIYCSERATDILGYPIEEMLGKTPFDFMLPEEAARVAPLFNDFIAHSANIPALENWNARKDGKHVCLLTSGVAILDEAGNLTGYRGVDTDITERKHIEAERERFTTRLRTAAYIAEQVSAILDPNELLQTVISLIKEKFGLYYVHIYTLDETSAMLNLRAGYGEPGRIMLERRHSIPLAREASLVATAARTKSLVHVPDVTVNPNFLPNPLLPDTKTEVAVPLVVGEQVLGVFDIQHDVPNYFTQAYLDVFTTLAGQIATALQNAQFVAAQRASEAQQRVILESSPVPILITTVAGQILYANPQTSDLFQMPLNTLMALQSPILYKDPVDRQTFLAHLEQQGHVRDLEIQFKKANGAPFWALLSTEKITFAGQPALLNSIYDISGQRQAQEELNRQLGILENSDDYMAAVDMQGKQIYINRAGARMLGYDNPHELIGKAIKDAHTPEDTQRVEREAIPVALAGKVWRSENRILRQDGTLIPVDQRVFAIWDEHGEPQALATIMTDITERKRTEAERERFTILLSTASEISGQVNAIRDPDALLNTVIPLLKERFDLYHAHIYTLEGDTLHLRAGYGEPGRIMLKRGHSIPLERETSLVATAARTKTLVHMPDVTTTANFLPNPLLPDTKTEVAVPLVVGEQVLGVFDIQHDVPNYFTQAYLDVFTTLAGQIATALQNAQFIEQVEQQRALYDGILQHLPVGVWAVDNQFNILLVNDTGRTMMGREIQGQEGGDYVETYEMIHLDTGALYDNAQLPLVKAVTQGGTHTATDAGVRRPDGTVVPMLINAGPLLNPQGQQMGGVVIFADATEQKKAQAESERLLAETQIRLNVRETLSEAQTEAAVLDAMVKVAGFYPQAQILITLQEEQAGVHTFNAVRSEFFESHIPPVLQTGMRFSTVEFPLLQHLSAENDFISNEVFADDRIDAASLALGEQMGAHSFAMFPLTVGAEWLGTLTVAAQAPGFFDEHRAYLYRSLAEQGAAALQAARLRDQLSLTQFSVNRGPAAIYWLRPDASLYDVNETACQMLGYTREELLTIPRFTDLDPNFPPEAWTPHWAAIKETQHMIIQSQHRDKEGRLIPVEIELNYLKYGDQEFNCAFARDITDRLAAEREIQTGRQMLQEVIDSLPESIFWKDKNLVYLGCNTRFAHDTGFASAAEVIGKTDFDMPWQTQAELYREDDFRVIASGEPKLNYEEPQTTPTGATIWLRTNKVPLYDAEGNIYAVLGAYADITSAIEAQAERTRLSAILEATTDFVGIATPEGRGIYFNRGAREMIGLALDADPAAYNITMVSPEQEITRTMNEIIPTAIKEGAWSGESIIKTLAGREIPVLMTIISIKDAAGALQYLANVSRDITEIKRAEAERTRFATQLSTAAQIAAQITQILDPDELFETVIPLMKERFDLYHVHFYSMEQDALVLQAGYGRVGKIMKQQGFKIPLNSAKSLAVRAARSGEIVWINDVTQEEGYLPNLLLPNTKAEVAVPAMIGNEVLGVLDVQADTVGAFSSADLDVFRTLVGQIATAFQNARAFEYQRRAEMAQRDVAERVRAIFEVMTEGITVTNTLGQIEDLNEATLRLHGYADREEVLGRSAMELFARTDWGRASQRIRQALESGRSETAEYQMVRKNGAVFDAEQNSALLHDAEGAPAGFVSITRDITERKRAEEALRLTRASVDQAATEIFWVDEQGQITDVNVTACNKLGYSREELLTMTIFDINPGFPRTALPALLTQINEAGSVTLTSQHHTKDGRVFPIELNAYSVRFGDQIHYFYFAQDITDRLRAEAERERFTMQLRTAAEVSTQVGAILDPQQLLELVVPLVADRFDLYHVHVYTLDEETKILKLRVGSGEAGRRMQEKGHAIPLDHEQSLVARVARTRQAILVNNVAEAPDFLPNPLLPNTRAELVVPLLVADRLLGVLDVQDDETDRFTAGDMDVFTTLAGQIAAAFLTATSYDRVLEIDRLKGEFLANMSHELRTPMNSILGYTEVMLMGIDGELTPEMEEDVQAIFENGQQLLRLINDILDLTKIEAGRMTLTKELVDVLPVLEDSRVNNLGLLHKRKTEVEIVIDADEELPFIMADRVRLGQVLNNLVSNAVKFTEKGFIYLRAHQVGEHVVIEVEDTGIGMSKEDQSKIFERFRQVDGSSTRRAEGTGLGLAISRSLVQMHGWEMKLTSELGKGTTFSIYIPAEDDDMG